MKKNLRFHLAALMAAGLYFAPTAGLAYQVVQKFPQEESRDGNGRITVEKSMIHVVACNSHGENGGQFYIYQYLNRHGFRAIKPPDWGHPLGGKDFGTFGEAVAVACHGHH